MKKKKTLPAFEVGSGNIFADLGLPNPEEHQLKAALVVQLHRLIKTRKLTQTAAAKLIGIKQPDLSNILRGHYQGFSIERLMRMLTAFDQDVEITVRPRRSNKGEAGRITFNTDAALADIPCAVSACFPGNPATMTSLRWVVSKPPMPRPIVLYIDADACPVKQEVYRVAERLAARGTALKVVVVSNAPIAVPRDDDQARLNLDRPRRSMWR